MIQLYGIDGCKWCQKAQVLLETAGKPFQYTHVEYVNKHAFMDGFQTVFPDSTRTFPRVTKTETNPEKFEPVVKLIGGFDELLEELLHERI
ncbi:glutaredoxin protein [Rhizobium phage RHph_N34]|uniref:Glutaredoxin protein n=1 Tax=Rhizobium phage RHph_N34 TaxID=2509586 RepID=A0A7S5UYG4_9CAUD|nr:glutaredoxin protein [Rhizobium phage RHph_N34]QIG73884.1 glutaredoxin protein [Rhizobium phage RHph_N34]